MNEIKTKMKEGGCSPPQIRRFCSRVEQFLSDHKATISESSIQPVEEITHIGEIQPQPELLRQAAMVKLNGGLGTSMGLTGPKGLLEVKNGLDFYAICDQQIRSLEKEFGFRAPLIFMNSFNTDVVTRERLKGLGFEQELPWGFLQSQVPKITEDGGLPEVEEEYAWCPPGHGDIYASLLDTGLREKLLAEGIRYLFVSNIDNLGAVLDSRPLVYMKERKFSFLMEVTRRGENDRKGGHLALDENGKPLLREVAQCPEEDLESFQNIRKHRYFNTNNLWIDLEAVNESWTELPLIVNRKPVKPHEPGSQMVVQLEQAMGAAIGIVESAGAMVVDRDRFVPVKTTNELFLLRSDLYDLSGDFTLEQKTDSIPRVELDSRHYKMIHDFDKLVQGVPSLKECHSLKVEGPITLKGDEVLRGDVHLRAG